MGKRGWAFGSATVLVLAGAGCSATPTVDDATRAPLVKAVQMVLNDRAQSLIGPAVTPVWSATGGVIGTVALSKDFQTGEIRIAGQIAAASRSQASNYQSAGVTIESSQAHGADDGTIVLDLTAIDTEPFKPGIFAGDQQTPGLSGASTPADVTAEATSWEARFRPGPTSGTVVLESLTDTDCGSPNTSISDHTAPAWPGCGR